MRLVRGYGFSPSARAVLPAGRRGRDGGARDGELCPLTQAGYQNRPRKGKSVGLPRDHHLGRLDDGERRLPAPELQLVNGIAVALIALVAGLEINFGRVKARLASMIAYGGVTILVMYLTMFAIFYLGWPWLPVAPDASGAERLAIIGVLTTLVVSFSPTVTIAVSGMVVA